MKIVALFCVCAAVGLSSAHAQVYRIVGPDGKVTFSDRAPEGQTPPTAPASATPGAATTGAALPYELRQIAARFAVTLYSSEDCAPCTSARQLLMQRGIPFTERTVATREDIQAFKNLFGHSNLPLGTIGGQQLIGFSEAEWTQYLDLAGYPKKSQLPSTYRRAPATPLAASAPKAPVPAPAQTKDEAASEPPSAPTITPAAPTGPSNPAGIIF